MTFEIDRHAVGARSNPVERSWTPHDCMLYALAVGAGHDPLDGLEFTTENTGGTDLRVLPTMAVVLAPIQSDVFSRAGRFDRTKLVHAGHSLAIHTTIPTAGSLRSATEIVGVFDKGSGAVIETRSTATSLESNEPLFEIGSTAFIRGAGGFGGDRGPSVPTNHPPDRGPDHVVTYATRPDQALLYRLTGDRNPMHSDPSFAARAGFDRPILHGLCTYGFTGRALLQALCAGEPSRFRGMEARFTSPVMPGEPLTVRMWIVAAGEAIFTTVVGDGRAALTAGRCTFAP
jgi:acyl dehydratase